MVLNDLLLYTVKLASRKLIHYSWKYSIQESCAWLNLTWQGDFSKSLVAVFCFFPEWQSWELHCLFPHCFFLYSKLDMQKLDIERNSAGLICLLVSFTLLCPSVTSQTFLHQPETGNTLGKVSISRRFVLAFFLAPVWQSVVMLQWTPTCWVVSLET